MKQGKEIQQLDLNLLKVFESLYQEQNMTRTAERLHLTPSAVSHAVKRLRESLNDPLFERSQNRMLPTPACQRMAPLIIDNLTRLRQILQQWGGFEPSSSQHHFRVAMHDAFEPSILPRLVEKLKILAPNVTLASVKIERNQLTRALASGSVDLAFDVAMPIKPPVRHREVINDNFCVLTNQSNPLVSKMSESDYFEAQHIAVSNRPVGAAIEDLILQQSGLARKIALRCQNFYSAREILKTSDLLLTLPRSLASRLVEPGLKIIAIPFEMPKVVTHLYWHQNTEQDAALGWLRNLLMGIVQDTLAE